jgi:hypothetical protein
MQVKNVPSLTDSSSGTGFDDDAKSEKIPLTRGLRTV